MPWIPSFTVDGGLFAGQAFPYGSLTGFINDYPNNPIAIQNGLYCGNSETTLGWAGSFGAAGDQLVAYGLDHKDNTYHYFDGIILDVKNPEGAQFYKQQLVIEMCVGFSTEMTSTVTIGGEQVSVTYVSGTFGIRNIWRREYATPYSTPTQTVLAGAAREITFTYVISGDIRALPRGYSNQIFGKLYVPLAFGTYSGNDTEYFGCGLYLQYTNAASTGYTKSGYVGVKHETINNAFMIDFKPPIKEDPNEDGDEDGDNGDQEGGGDGDHDKHQDNILIPDLPSLSASGAGFVTMYRMTQSNMLSFARKLFDPEVWDTVKAFFADPLDFICGIMIVPYAPTTGGMAMPIFPRQSPLPDIEWGEYYQIIENQYKVIDCGSYTIPLFYNSAFDYSPYTKVSVWLPYIGYRDLNADEVVGSTIHIEYHCDCLTGDCIAFISRLAISGGGVPVNQVIAQFNGNCGVRVPFGRMSFDSAITGSMQLIAGAAGALGGIASMIAGSGGMPSGGKQLAEGMVASQVGGMAMGAVNAMKARVERAGAAGASAGYMAIQKPYIIRQIPHQSLPSNYRRLNGYPSNIGGTLGDFSGYTCVESIELTGISATADEKREILSLLTGGVIV